ncbi:hypothetical protein [Cryptosporangium sp. NPDC051539]|uniref:hypothetical protein n=1 Tax=Cryptosporangium sp. NPDC051539 TaxID=3363962 RepID=UPI00379A8B62
MEVGEVTFDGAYYFHGTRVMRSHAFLEEGILPLGAVLDRLWKDLYGLCSGAVTPSRWSALREESEGDAPSPMRGKHGAYLYRMKFVDGFHFGPYASLVRAHAMNPIDGEHDYVKSPEIVEDIARCLELDLQELFEARVRSCVVKFFHRDVDLHAVETRDVVRFGPASRTATRSQHRVRPRLSRCCARRWRPV